MNSTSKQQKSERNGSSAVRILSQGLSVIVIQSHLKGRVAVPGDPDYDLARTVFYGGFDRHPALIARVSNTNDIANVIALARDTTIMIGILWDNVDATSIKEFGISATKHLAGTFQIYRQSQTMVTSMLVSSSGNSGTMDDHHDQ